jgi:hypothetical protein
MDNNNNSFVTFKEAPSAIKSLKNWIFIAKATGILIIVVIIIIGLVYVWRYLSSIFNFTKDLGKDIISGSKKVIDKTKQISKSAVKGTKKAGEKVAKGTKEASKKVAKGTKEAGKKIAKGGKNIGKDIGEGGKKVGKKTKKLFTGKKKKKKKKKDKEGFFGKYDDDDTDYWNKLYGYPDIPQGNDILMNQSCLCRKGFCTCTYGSTTDYVNKYVYSDVPWKFYPSKNIYQFGKFV